MAGTVEIPLFPLNTVLFPGGPLPLRIFETRYLDLVRRCLREASGFGVVLIREGREAGGPAETCDVGTYGRIVDFSQLEDGLLGIRVRGERRFRIVARRRARDGLNLADVEWLAADAVTPLPEEFVELGPLVERVLDELEDFYRDEARHPAEAGWVSMRLAEVLPLPVGLKQHCLELDDPLERLRFLRPLFEYPRS